MSRSHLFLLFWHTVTVAEGVEWSPLCPHFFVLRSSWSVCAIRDTLSFGGINLENPIVYGKTADRLKPTSPILLSYFPCLGRAAR